MTSPHFWVLVALFIIGIIFHYPQQILGVNSPSLLSFLGLSRHAMERILFLIPITYSGMIFGLKTGLISMAISLVIMLPRVFLLSDYKAESFFETGAVIILGVFINLWLEIRRKENTLYQQLVYRLEESERDMGVSEQKYRYLFENASDAIWLQDMNGIFIDGNRTWEKLTGYNREEVKGINVAKFLSEDSLARAREVRNKLVRGEEFAQPYEQEFYVKGGFTKAVKMSTNAVFSGSTITGFEHVARDVTEEKQQQENVRAYIQQITRAQEEERKRVARDLHDDVSPDIIVLMRKLDALTSVPRLKLSIVKENLKELRDDAVKALEALRATAQGLRPRIIDDLGLVAALEWIAEELEKDQKIQVNVETKNMDRALTPETQIVLFRIAQEALNNIRKHAHASSVSIRVESDDEYIKMMVTDDGQGFNVPEKIDDMVGAGRLGLMGMYERALLLNGNLKIKSSPGNGSQITVTLPWPVKL
jgi:two-component system sensor histidine kinase DegS